MNKWNYTGELFTGQNFQRNIFIERLCPVKMGRECNSKETQMTKLSKSVIKLSPKANVNKHHTLSL